MIEKLSNKEHPTMRQRMIINYIKYGPYLMALTCALKIFIFNNHMPEFCQYINIILNVIMAIGFLIVGLEFNYSKYHAMVCYVAFLGYIVYTGDLIFNFPENISMSFSYIYLYIVFLLFVLYKKI